MFLGTKIGVGSLIGTSIAVYEAGPSSIIWIIIFSLITSSLVYYESFLGYTHREKVNDSYISGPNYYIKNKALKYAYIITFLITYTFFFLMIQINSLSGIILLNINIPKYVLFVFLFVLLTILLITKSNQILKILNKLVLFMCLMLLVIFITIVLKNIKIIDLVFINIIEDFLSYKSMIYSIVPALIISLKRNIFQTELLLGTTSISASVSSSSVKETASIQVLGSYFISLIISVLVTISIVIYKIQIKNFDGSYFELINNVFIHHLGAIGGFILIIVVLLFCLTTVISAFYFGINNIIKYFSKFVFIYKFTILFIPLCGIFIKEGVIWDIVDNLLFILMLINSLVILKYIKSDKNDY